MRIPILQRGRRHQGGDVLGFKAWHSVVYAGPKPNILPISQDHSTLYNNPMVGTLPASSLPKFSIGTQTENSVILVLRGIFPVRTSLEETSDSDKAHLLQKLPYAPRSTLCTSRSNGDLDCEDGRYPVPNSKGPLSDLFPRSWMNFL